MRAFRTLAALVVAVALAAGLSLSRNDPGSEQAAWLCVYVDHVHLFACQDKPIDFYPDEEQVPVTVPDAPTVVESVTDGA